MLIRDQKIFEDLLNRCREQGSFAFDTEFLRENTYWPELCLIQIGIEGDRRCAETRDIRSDAKRLRRNGAISEPRRRSDGSSPAVVHRIETTGSPNCRVSRDDDGNLTGLQAIVRRCSGSSIKSVRST